MQVKKSPCRIWKNCVSPRPSDNLNPMAARSNRPTTAARTRLERYPAAVRIAAVTPAAPTDPTATDANPGADRVLLAGIDEAGYGPVLGPLVMTVVGLDAPAATADADLWRVLNACVARRYKKREPRVIITDSKTLSSRPDGFELLELSALSMLGAAGIRARSLSELCAAVAPAAWRHASGYDWYAGRDPGLPIAVSEDLVRTSANGLAHGLRQEGVDNLRVCCEVLDAGEFNELVARTKNKSTVQFTLTLRLLSSVADGPAGGPRTSLSTSKAVEAGIAPR
jgi:hypothetical protein